jgi:hypothetical protein
MGTFSPCQWNEWKGIALKFNELTVQNENLKALNSYQTVTSINTLLALINPSMVLVFKP